MTTARSRHPVSDGKCTVAIVGGGFTGAAVALHLAANRPLAGGTITVFEPRSQIGRGLAYDTDDPAHRINVPAGRMNLLPEDPDHFLRWIEHKDAVAEDPSAMRPDGSLYPRRAVFGAYVHDNLRPFLEDGRIRHIRSRVTRVTKAGVTKAGVTKAGGTWIVQDEAGHRVTADFLVIAATHPAPTPPASLSGALAGHPRYIADATLPDALAPIRPDDRVLVIGNGLTAADVIASLDRRGHRGSIVALSRRGLRSKGHAPFVQEPYGDFLSPAPRTARDLLARARATVREAVAAGMTWHAVLDQLRGQAGDLWQALPEEERRRLVRHLRVYWDVHRFRIAPQVEDVIDRGIASGRVRIVAASIVMASIVMAGRAGDDIGITIRSRNGGQATEVFDAVVVTTGPAHGHILQSQPWLAEMAAQGQLCMDPTGLGIACDAEAHAIGPQGDIDASLFIAGPLARGRFGELMGLPQVSDFAAFVAQNLARACARRAVV